MENDMHPRKRSQFFATAVNYRCLLNKEDPALYDSKRCRKGLPDIESRTLLPQADHCDKRSFSFQNRDLVINPQNHEYYNLRSEAASLPPSTSQTNFSAVKHVSIDNPSVEFYNQQRSNAYSWLDAFLNINLAAYSWLDGFLNINLAAYSWQDGFSKINLANENEIRPVTSARDNQQNHECYDRKSQEASLASSTVQTIKHLSIDNSSVEFDEQERSNAYHLQDGFSKNNLADENVIRPVTSARDEGYNNLAIAHKTKSKVEYPFKCEQCPKQFRHKKNLKHHTLVHGAEARFICDVCSKGFMIESEFKRHLKVHAINVEVKCPFKCDKCPKRYSVKQDLKQHMLDHGAQAKFICDFCSKGFMENGRLKTHIKQVHKNNVTNDPNSAP